MLAAVSAALAVGASHSTAFAALPADIAVGIEQVASTYNQRVFLVKSRQQRGVDSTLTQTILRNDKRLAESRLIAVVSSGITRDSRLTEELVSTAVGAAPDLRRGLERGLIRAYPGFRHRILRAASNPIGTRPRPAPRPLAVAPAPQRVVLRPPGTPRPAATPGPAPPSAVPPPPSLDRVRPPRTAPVVRTELAPPPAPTPPVTAPTRGRETAFNPPPFRRATPDKQDEMDEADELDELDDESLLEAQKAAGEAISGGKPASPDMDPINNDPIEDFNRVSFAFNDALDQWIFRPITWVYRKVVPGVVRRRVALGFQNLASPIVFANDLLQIEFEEAGITLGRFAVNSTIGVAGLFDVATDWGLVHHDGDFGETLNTYDVGAGPYVVLPFLGPGTLRHGAGRFVDGFFAPLNYIVDFPTRLAFPLGEALVARDGAFNQIDTLRETSIDYYAAIRALYYQNRAAFLNRRSEEDAPARR